MEHAHKIRIFAPRTEIETVAIEDSPAGVMIKGTCSLPVVWAAEPVAVKEFANCLMDADSVRRFTKRFGPLWEIEQKEAGSFAFLLSHWVAARNTYRMAWDRLLGLDISEDNLPPVPADAGWLKNAQAPWKRVKAGGVFEAAGKELAFVADSLYSALTIKLYAISGAGRLRRCPKIDCELEKYFIADHGKQRYCSELHAQEKQAELKAEWWAGPGQVYRRDAAGRAGKSKGRTGKKAGAKDGTRKTR